MRERFRTSYPVGRILLWLVTILFCLLFSLSAARANERGKEIVDRLHGFAFTPQEGWNPLIVGNAILFHDGYRFVLVRAVRYDGNLQKAAQAWLDERKASEDDFRVSRYAFRKVAKGVVLYGEGLPYPYALLPMQAVNFGLTGKIPPNDYREVTSILPGEKYALVVTYLFPEGTPKTKLDEMTQGQRDFNSRMATAWSNLLSDQTYVRDPQTGEISRVYKQSWETGGFWREPVFGDLLLGGVKEGSRLEELLRSEGWRRLQESLEGFPQK